MSGPKLLWVSYSDLWRYQCDPSWLVDSEEDPVNEGYYLSQDNPAVTYLALRGCRLTPRHPSGIPQSLSKVLGRSISGLEYYGKKV